MGGLDLKSLLSSSSLNAIQDEECTSNKIKIVQLSIHDLIPSEDNFYSVEDITTLKNSIEIFGIKQNLTVKQEDNGKYTIIAGHRRRLASLALVEEGKTEYEMLPCSIESELDGIKEQLLLITTNATTRQLTDWEKTQQAKKMRELLEHYKKQEKIPGRIRELIAEILETSPSQVGRMESISKNLTDPFQEEFKQEHINISTAYELSTLPEDKQEDVLIQYKDQGSLSIKDVKEKKAEIKETVIEDSVIREQEDNKHIQEQEQGTCNQKQEINNNYLEKTTSGRQLDQDKVIESRKPEVSIKTIYELLQDMSKKELATFICYKCDGSGFCDHFAECNYSSIDERPKICEKWLGMEAQRGN